MQNRWLSVHSALVDETGRNAATTRQWLEHIEAALTAHGASAGEASRQALAALDNLISRQVMLIASEDMYRLIAVLAICGAIVILAQRRIFAS